MLPPTPAPSARSRPKGVPATSARRLPSSLLYSSGAMRPHSSSGSVSSASATRTSAQRGSSCRRYAAAHWKFTNRQKSSSVRFAGSRNSSMNACVDTDRSSAARATTSTRHGTSESADISVPSSFIITVVLFS